MRDGFLETKNGTAKGSTIVPKLLSRQIDDDVFSTGPLVSSNPSLLPLLPPLLPLTGGGSMIKISNERMTYRVKCLG